MFTKQLLFLLFAIHSISANENLCTIQETCEKCLAADYNCGWCTDINFESTLRCMPKDKLPGAGCSSSQIVLNQAMNEVIKNEATKDYQAVDGSAVQIQPQKIKLRLVKSRTEQIQMTYRPAKNNPLDLYFLMDLTWSMRDDKETLVKVGRELAQALNNLTVNSRLGYGSYADKPTMPMIMPGFEKNPCKVEKTKCEPTYGFHHHLALTADIQDFIRKVNGSQVTGNLDNLEGGLDALMQVLVCSEQIGWKDEARKIVILATDGFLHFAGDGLLAGIVKKNDKKCHLNERGEYTGSLDYDYPSLEEIYRELAKRKISIIFAVTKEVKKDYDEIRKLMKEIASVEILRSDSSNILELVRKGYQSFAGKVHLVDNSPSYISVSYETNCGGREKFAERNSCEELELGQSVDFHINITLADFPSDGVYHHIIRVEEPGISEFLEVEVEIQKPCPCQENEKSEEGNHLCNNHGRFVCGMCTCDEGWIGNACTCDSRNYTSMQALEKNCRQSPDRPICSDRGECECGKCYCNRGYTGEYCDCPECTDCEDPDRMECICGQCVCKYGWSGKRCNCPKTNEGCISPKGDVCSGHGTCECGNCECKKSYFGKFCEANSLENNNLCLYYLPCVKCLIEQREGINMCQNLSEICSNSNGIRFSYDFTTESLDKDIFCVLPVTTKDDVKCRHFYTYDTDEFGVSYLQIKVEDCAPVNYAIIGGVIFIGTVLAGIAMIVACKTIVYFHDKAEFAKFEKQLGGTYMEENPIFNNPVRTYTVPKSSDDENGF